MAYKVFSNEIAHLRTYVESKLTEIKGELKKEDILSAENSRQNHSGVYSRGRKRLIQSNSKLSNNSRTSQKSQGNPNPQLVGSYSQIRPSAIQTHQVSYAYSEDQRSLKSQRNDQTLFDYSCVTKSIPEQGKLDSNLPYERLSNLVDHQNKENIGDTKNQKIRKNGLFDYIPNPEVENIKRQYLPSSKTTRKLDGTKTMGNSG